MLRVRLRDVLVVSVFIFASKPAHAFNLSGFLKKCKAALVGEAKSPAEPTPPAEAGPRSLEELLAFLNQEEFASFDKIVEQNGVDTTRFVNREDVSGLGSYHSIYSAYDESNLNQKLFVKVIDSPRGRKQGTLVGKDITLIANQFRWARLLELKGWGPKVIGASYDESGRPLIVSEYFEGRNFIAKYSGKLLQSLSADAKQRAIIQLKEMRKYFVELKIRPVDLQFRVSEDGEVKIIDPEFFDLQEGIASPSDDSAPASAFEPFISALERS